MAGPVRPHSRSRFRLAEAFPGEQVDDRQEDDGAQEPGNGCAHDAHDNVEQKAFRDHEALIRDHLPFIERDNLEMAFDALKERSRAYWAMARAQECDGQW